MFVFDKILVVPSIAAKKNLIGAQSTILSMKTLDMKPQLLKCSSWDHWYLFYSLLPPGSLGESHAGCYTTVPWGLRDGGRVMLHRQRALRAGDGRRRSLRARYSGGDRVTGRDETAQRCVTSKSDQITIRTAALYYIRTAAHSLGWGAPMGLLEVRVSVAAPRFLLSRRWAKPAGLV